MYLETSSQHPPPEFKDYLVSKDNTRVKLSVVMVTAITHSAMVTCMEWSTTLRAGCSPVSQEMRLQRSGICELAYCGASITVARVPLTVFPDVFVGCLILTIAKRNWS